MAYLFGFLMLSVVGVFALHESLLSASTPRAELSSSDAERDFSRASALLEDGKESQALVSFTDFLRRYRGNKLAAEAQYFVAEIFMRRRDYAQALLEYGKVYKFENGNAKRVPDAGLRIGDCLAQVGKNSEAIIEYEAVVRRYPKSPASIEAKNRLLALSSSEKAKHE